MENRLSTQELVNKFKSIIAANVRRKRDLDEIIKTIDVDNYGIITIYLSRGATYGEAENIVSDIEEFAKGCPGLIVNKFFGKNLKIGYQPDDHPVDEELEKSEDKLPSSGKKIGNKISGIKKQLEDVLADAESNGLTEISSAIKYALGELGNKPKQRKSINEDDTSISDMGSDIDSMIGDIDDLLDGFSNLENISESKRKIRRGRKLGEANIKNNESDLEQIRKELPEIKKLNRKVDCQKPFSEISEKYPMFGKLFVKMVKEAYDEFEYRSKKEAADHVDDIWDSFSSDDSPEFWDEMWDGLMEYVSEIARRGKSQWEKAAARAKDNKDNKSKDESLNKKFLKSRSCHRGTRSKH